jgi:cell surface protein SprA
LNRGLHRVLFFVLFLGLRISYAQNNGTSNPIDLKDPSVVKKEVVYDPVTNRYVVKEVIGEDSYKPADDQSFEDFWANKSKQSEKQYWKEKSKENSNKNGDFIGNLMDPDNSVSLFGSNFVEIKPQGSAELTFGVTSQKTENPLVRVENQRVTNIDFNQKIQLNVQGIIGEKLFLNTNYNTEATFDFENQMKLNYKGSEDEIIKNVELGNVSLPLNSTLIKGSQNLFGVKANMQFGKLKVSTILTQQKSDSKSINLSGGAQTIKKEVKIDQYDDNRHFFLSQYFYENYDNALRNLPVISTEIQITQLEVWITNVGISANNDARNVIAFTDLGEANPYQGTVNPSINARYPSNNSNDLYEKLVDNSNVRSYNNSSGELLGNFGMQDGIHFNKIENARRLNPNEYFYHPQLGFISLNRKMEEDEVLAVAFQYTVASDGSTRKVGEFSTDAKEVKEALYLKMLKSTQVNNTQIPLWDLMMKNVYSLGTSGVDASTLEIDVFYNNPKTNNNINYLPSEGSISENKRWLQYLGVDKVDPQLNPNPDGRYDIVNGVTIRMENGRIYFPSTKPFGSALRNAIADNSVADNYAFDSLYYIPKWRAINDFPDKNRFVIKAKYQAQSNIINLNSFSIPEGAVTVTAGGRKLQEGTDFRVNYQTGQLTILNESVLNSNTPIKVDVESNSMFASMSKNLFGTHLDYEINKNFHVGGTFMNLTERPLTQKNQQGIEPTSNTVWGLNTNYTNESAYLTKLVDKLPFISTKEKSKIQFTGEFAQLVPGSPRAIKDAGSGEAQSYIDAFEAGQTNINLANRLSWVLASTPQGQTQSGMWPEGQLFNDLAYGFNRSKLAWYNIDPIFIANNSNTPDYMRKNPRIQANHYQRVVQQSELFPNRSLAIGQVTTLLTFDVAYFPQERGPYNYDTTGGTFSKGIDPQTGLLNDPSSRWGGIMRAMNNVDFETRNIEFIEFWMMNPFEDENGDINAFGGGMNGGDFYIHLGNISEDILKDGRRSFENGLPLNASQSTDVDETVWGRVSNRLNFVNAFDNDPDTRAAQDVGLDGLNNADERTFFRSYLNWFGANPPSAIATDPSGDDYQYFRGEELDNLQANVIDRYKKFNGLEGNSATQEQTGLDFISTSSILPDIEDINRDNTLSEGESYYQYKISLRPNDLEESDIGTNYINQIYNTTVTVEGVTKDITWYQFRIPIRTPDTTIGKITDFQSIRFMRMAFKNWQDPVVLRFATLDLVQSNWRQYRSPLYDQTQAVPDQTGSTFTLGRVNVEEDSKKKPVRYLEPPNIQRQFNLASQNFENEQALQLRVCDLDGGDARAIFKMESRDLLSYNKIKMDLHASQIGDAIANLNDMNMSVFIRIGTDFDQNYYEYEVPMSFTDPALVSANNNESARQEIWKAINMMDFNYKEAFVGLKMTRNERGIPIDQRFKGTDGKNNVYVRGNPTMANVRTIMIGVRNNNPRGQKRCAEFWVNELRLSDFDNNSGWAATSSVNMQLADLGNLSFGGGYSTPGWGSIDQKISDRSRETIRNFDATGNFQMGKFFPEKTNLSVPLYFSYNRIRKDLQYNPLDTDVEMMELDRNSDVRKRLNLITPDVLINRSVNFSNVRKNLKPGAKPKIYSIENFDVTYAFSEMNQRDVNTELNSIKNFKGALNYNFRPKAGKYEPFIKTPILNSMEQKKLAKMDAEEKMLKDSLQNLRKYDPNSPDLKLINERLKVLKDEKMEYKRKMAKLKRSPYLQLGREFHVFYLPKNVSIQTDMNRMFSERMIRNVTGDDILIDPVFNKNWFFNRTYRMDYDLTQSLKMDITAKNQAFIDEPFGRLDTDQKKDSVWNNIKSLGRNTLYTQTSNINYNIPFNKFPLTNFITTSLRYSGKYDWQAAPLSMDTLGNNISNSNTKQVNAQLNLINFYNKFPYLKKISQKSNSPVKDPRALKANAEADSVKKKDPITAKDLFDGSLKFMMMVKNLNVTYSENNGTFIPGFTPKSEILGMNTQNQMAPGWGFVFGSQNDIIGEAINNNWLSSRDKFINTRVAFTKQNNFNWRASVEPIKKMRIDLDGKRTETFTDSYFYRLDDLNGGWNKFSPISTGQFSISILTISSAFGSREPRERSAAFKQMEQNRLIIAERLAQQNVFQSGVDPVTGFPTGYNSTQEEVLLYSFLSAYTGRDPKNQNLSPFSKFPIPNWRLNYTGMMDYEFIKKYFDSFTVSHAYNSTFNFNGYQNNPNFINGDELNNLGNFQTIWMYQNTTVGIQETFSPLIKFDMRFKNSVLGTLEYKQSRTIGLNFSNSAVVEQAMSEIVVGSGYTIRDLILPIKIRGQKLKSDLDIKANVSVRSSSLTMMVVDGDVTTTQGARILNININGDYRISQKVTARAFYTQTVNTPYIATSFPNSTSTGGISIRFTL